MTIEFEIWRLEDELEQISMAPIEFEAKLEEMLAVVVHQATS